MQLGVRSRVKGFLPASRRRGRESRAAGVDELGRRSKAQARNSCCAPLGQRRGGLFIAGRNDSADLFMFWKRRVEGLRADRARAVAFVVKLATNVPRGVGGAGGSPDGSVFDDGGSGDRLRARRECLSHPQGGHPGRESGRRRRDEGELLRLRRRTSRRSESVTLASNPHGLRSRKARSSRSCVVNRACESATPDTRDRSDPAAGRCSSS